MPSNEILKGKNYCLFIAIDKYKNGLTELDNCVYDAKKISSILVNKYQFELIGGSPLFNENATRDNILSAIRSLRGQVTKDDNLIIYFSGHGENIDDIGYWLPFGAKKGVDSGFVSSSDLTDRLKSVGCHHMLLVVDACFSGSIFLKTKSSISNRKDEKRPSRNGFSSCHSREYALDGNEEENSPFAKNLLAELEKNNGPLSVSKLANSVSDAVRLETKERQNPIFRPLDVRGDELGRFVLYPKVDPFKNVLSLAKKGYFDAASEDLQKYCLAYEKLPKGYEFLLCGLKNKMILCDKIEEEWGVRIKEGVADVNFHLNDVVKDIQNYSPQDDNDFVHVLELISKNSIVDAVKQLREKYKDVPLVRIELTLFSFRAKLLELAYDTMLVTFVYFYKEYCKIINALICILQILNNKNVNRVDYLDLALEFVNAKAIPHAISLIDYYLVTHSVDGDEWYFLQMLADRERSNEYKSYLGIEEIEDAEIEKNKIYNALKYLIGRLEKSYTYGNHFSVLIDSEFKDLEKCEYPIMNGEVFLSIQTEYFNKFDWFNLLSTNYNSLKFKNMSGLINGVEWYGGLTNIVRMFLVGIYQLSGIDLGMMGFNELDRDAADTIDYTLQNAEYQVSINHPLKAIEILKVLGDYEQELNHLSYEYKMNEEDRIFTRKPLDLVTIREDKLRMKLLQIIKKVNDKAKV